MFKILRNNANVSKIPTLWQATVFLSSRWVTQQNSFLQLSYFFLCADKMDDTLLKMLSRRTILFMHEIDLLVFFLMAQGSRSTAIFVLSTQWFEFYRNCKACLAKRYNPKEQFERAIRKALRLLHDLYLSSKAGTHSNTVWMKPFNIADVAALVLGIPKKVIWSYNRALETMFYSPSSSSTCIYGAFVSTRTKGMTW